MKSYLPSYLVITATLLTATASSSLGQSFTARSQNRTSSVESYVGQSLKVVEKAFKKQGFTWKAQYDNRYTIFTADRGKTSYSCYFTRLTKSQKWVCESIYSGSQNQSFQSAAPKDWKKREIYISVVLPSDTRNSTPTCSVNLMKRNKNGSYLRWSGNLKVSREGISCQRIGNKWKITITPSWVRLPVEFYDFTLRGVSFDRPYSGAEEPSEEVYTSGYFKNMGVQGTAVRWYPTTSNKVVYLPVK